MEGRQRGLVVLSARQHITLALQPRVRYRDSHHNVAIRAAGMPALLASWRPACSSTSPCQDPKGERPVQRVIIRRGRALTAVSVQPLVNRIGKCVPVLNRLPVCIPAQSCVGMRLQAEMPRAQIQKRGLRGRWSAHALSAVTVVAFRRIEWGIPCGQRLGPAGTLCAVPWPWLPAGWGKAKGANKWREPSAPSTGQA
jgi:hypothetical protein